MGVRRQDKLLQLKKWFTFLPLNAARFDCSLLQVSGRAVEMINLRQARRHEASDRIAYERSKLLGLLPEAPLFPAGRRLIGKLK